MDRKIVVTKCTQCPYWYVSPVHNNCSRSRELIIHNPSEDTPSWCPLPINN